MQIVKNEINALYLCVLTITLVLTDEQSLITCSQNHPILTVI